jgi:ribosomal protein S26
MLEDEIGLRKALGHANFVQCSRCGAAIPAREATVVTADALNSEAEYAPLCARCRDELADGEQDLPLEPEE